MPSPASRTRRVIASILPLLLATAVFAPVAGAASTLIVEVSNASANEAHFMKAFDAASFTIADFNGDGFVEIVAHNDNQYVYVISTTSATILAEFKPDYPPGWGVRPINDVAVGDVDGDGVLDIVVTNSAAVTCRYEFEPEKSSASKFSFAKRWCHRANDFDFNAAADGGPWLEDVDGDGKLETFMATEERGLYAYNHDGKVRWKSDKFGGNAGPMVTDLDGDGKKEVLFFGDGGEVRAMDASTGATKWEFFAQSHVWPASIPVAGNAADLDGDGKKEVVFTARDAHDAKNLKNNHLVLFVLDHNGKLKWKTQPSWANPMSYTHPVLEDIDGDGKREIILQDWNTMGHKPGNWEALGPANVFVYEHDGKLKWRTSLDNTWSNDDLVVADVDGDGKYEILAIGFAPGGADGIWFLDAATGAKEQHVPNPGWTSLRGPVAGNFDKGNDLEWAVPIHDTPRGGGFRVYDTTAPCKVLFGGWQLRDACNPPRSTSSVGGGDGGGSTPPPPPPSGSFSATFATNGGNDWWVSTKVNANKPLAGVDGRVNGGPWHGLDFKTWGDWAGSFHAPKGSVVEFRARSTSGDEKVSGNYLWPDGTPTSGGGGSTPPPPPSGSFTASFDSKGGNKWWVQVKVTANKPLAGVDARANGGPWHALELKSWGDWAGSFAVPDGSHVEFRARATGGDSKVSGKYVWPSGTPVAGGGGGGGGGTDPGFTAAFKNVRGNKWWVETEVTANQALTGVDARVNGGAWFPLQKQSWGSWATSKSVADGSKVEFRALASGGATATSGQYTWPPG